MTIDQAYERFLTLTHLQTAHILLSQAATDLSLATIHARLSDFENSCATVLEATREQMDLAANGLSEEIRELQVLVDRDDEKRRAAA